MALKKTSKVHLLQYEHQQEAEKPSPRLIAAGHVRHLTRLKSFATLFMAINDLEVLWVLILWLEINFGEWKNLQI